MRRATWYKWTVCALLLIVQLSAGVVSSWATVHTPPAISYAIDETPLEVTMPCGTVEADDVEVTASHLHTKRPGRIKLRYYVSPFCQQYDLTPRQSGVIPYASNWQPIVTDENKTGEYSLVRSFLPGYYQFLFRQTPF
ncbi:hypothetical protein MKQ68_08915 [Chitinophaga horti]|uniref:Uncharacterized protein n=1 Tax=Chitinophaga horti TaxID=2920382 RepID=A0ABY6J6S8_9BACT|nr:hypothetical protein [Chitinophaga horti]UYQ95215.1 hypothetical protein MKQ68_08915 [Chitinophaga horti]